MKENWNLDDIQALRIDQAHRMVTWRYNRPILVQYMAQMENHSKMCLLSVRMVAFVPAPRTTVPCLSLTLSQPMEYFPEYASAPTPCSASQAVPLLSMTELPVRVVGVSKLNGMDWRNSGIRSFVGYP